MYEVAQIRFQGFFLKGFRNYDIAIHMTIWMIICKQTVSILRIGMSDVNSLMLPQTRFL